MGFPAKIALYYALFSFLWVSGSDQLVEAMFEDITAIQTYKGWAFVLISSLFIWYLLQQEFARRNRTEQKLLLGKRQLDRLSQAVDQSPAAIVITDTEGRIEYVNNAFEKITSYSKAEAIGQNPRLFRSGKTPSSVYDELWETISQGSTWEGELFNQRKDHSTYWVHATISPVFNEAKEITHYLAIEEDISIRKAQEHTIRQQANYDSLTELPNRFLAMDRMSQAINVSIRNEQTVVVMFIDLDNFKTINDSLGHDTGDQLIMRAASRIRESVRQTDTVARYGGDEFLVILTDLESPDDASRVAEKILAAVATPYKIDDRELNITASIGMSMFPNDGQDPFELMRNADSAMFGAKDEGGNRYEYHSAAIKEAAAERLEIEQQLYRALGNNELSLYYQPLVDAKSGKIVCAEALLRWDNPKLGRIPPDRFIPLAEATGLILPIGEWVIRSSLAQLKQWRDNGMTDLKVSVNISPRQFGTPDLMKVIRSTLEELQLPGTALEIEVTETLLLRNHSETRKVLEQMEALGIRISLDDFGTGYSSLSYLKEFPFDTLKIDRSFIRDILEHEQDQALVKATLTMAAGLGLATVGEGVETEDQLKYLSDLGLDIVQGYFYTPPLPIDQFEQFYNNHKNSL